MKRTLIEPDVVERNIEKLGLKDLRTASIGEMRTLITGIEKESGYSFIRMEMGIPCLSTPSIAVEAEIDALKKGVGAIYPDFSGIPPLKQEVVRFAKLFLDIEVSPHCCLTTVGSTNGSYTAFMVSGRRDKKKDTILFIDPGFSLHKQCVKMIGLKQESFDVYKFRGEELKEKLESYLKKGHISTILYSNPNNPTWICLTPKELQIIGELATRYDVVVVEDLAYLTMDFRQDYTVPGQPPFQQTVAQYTDNYILLISSSKIFSLAGQRIGMMLLSDVLFDSNYNDLLTYYPTPNFGHSILKGTIYATTAGVSHSSQYALTAVLKAVNDGTYRYREDLLVYGEKAAALKKIFTQNGFEILYAMDEDEPIADGFYFTVSYPGMNCETLIRELLYQGISVMPLSGTGSDQPDGMRICVAPVSFQQFDQLEQRLNLFRQKILC